MSDLDRATHLLHRVGQCATDIFTRTVPAGAVTSRQFVILATIEADAGLSQTDLVEATGIDRSTIADIIARLIEKGLIERRRKEKDRRAYELRLTTYGKRVLRAVRPHYDSVNRQIEAAIPQHEKVFDALRLMLDRLSQEAV
jgi:DNA-binding MarR family transcriptional regulator